MNDQDIRTLRRILQLKGRQDLSQLLRGSICEVVNQAQLGSRFYSVISTFVVYSPLEQYLILRDLRQEDKETILESVVDIYPLADNAPEIVDLEFRILPVGENADISNVVSGGGIVAARAFLSYSTIDKTLAGEIKDVLEELGLQVFLAHEDIEPSAEWQETILEELELADIYIPVLTPNFRNSEWTDQEAGIAFEKGKIIVPLAVDGHMPYGFIERFQALDLLPQSVRSACESVIQVLVRRWQLTDEFVDHVVAYFAASDSFDEAGQRASLLLAFPSMDKILDAAATNDQILYSRSARPPLIEMCEKHREVVDRNRLVPLNEVQGLVSISI